MLERYHQNCEEVLATEGMNGLNKIHLFQLMVLDLSEGKTIITSLVWKHFIQLFKFYS